MEDWKENIVDELKRKMECCDCPLGSMRGGDCTYHNYSDCEHMWKDFLFNESGEKEERDFESGEKEERDFEEMREDILKFCDSIFTMPKEESEVEPVITVIKVTTNSNGEFVTEGQPKAVAEFMKLLGEVL